MTGAVLNSLSREELEAEVQRLRAALRKAGIDARRAADRQAVRETGHRADLARSRQEITAARANTRLAQADLVATEQLVADLVAVQQALVVSEERLALAIDAAGSLGWWDWDIPADRLYAGEHFARMFGVDPTVAAAGAPLSLFVDGIHPDDRVWVSERIQQTLETAGEFSEEYRLRHADGSVSWVYARGRGYHNAAGQAVRFPGVVLDITARKQADAALKASEVRLSTVLETIPVGILLAEAPSGRIVMGNHQGAAILGHSTLYAASSDDYDGFVAYHADGRLVAAQEYPLARICAGECDQANLEVEYQRPDGTRRWIEITGEAIKDADGHTTGAVVTFRDIAERKAAEAEQDILNRELSHRLKNTLAMVQAIATQTMRNASSLDAAREAFAARLIALSKAHDLLLSGEQEGASLANLVQGTLSIHDDLQAGRLRLDGPPIRVGSRAALSVSLIVHELATNAVKYGALSIPQGYVRIEWVIDTTGPESIMRLCWIEKDGPPVTPPTRRGFGTRLIERGLAAAFGGEVELTYKPEGVVCEITAPLAAITADE